MKKKVPIKYLHLLIITILLLPNFALAREPLSQPATNSAMLKVNISSFAKTNDSLVADIVVDPGGGSINAVAAILQFSTSSLQIEKLDFKNSFCDLFIEKIYNNASGTISILCGKPYPGIATEEIVAQISFKKVKKEEASISFSPDSMVLANDGYGINVLSSTTSLLIK